MQTTEMNGAESIVRTLAAAGVDTFFTNPGTSEMHFVAALDRVPTIRAVLGLFEGGVSGMADGYARMAERPAATLLHLGPGLGNAIANLHNARRAQTPMVNIVGEHARFHAQWDSPLASDIASLARPVSSWVHTATNSRTAAADAARAAAAASAAPGGIATLILPADAAWGPSAGIAPTVAVPPRGVVSDAAIARSVDLLRSGKPVVIQARGPVLRERGLAALGRIAAATGARVLTESLCPRIERGAGRFATETIAGRSETIQEYFANVAGLILLGGQPLMPGFGYPGVASWCYPPEMAIEYLALEHEDGLAAVEAVAEALGVGRGPLALEPLALPDLPTGKLDQFSVGAIVARYLPEGAIISDEAITNRPGMMNATRTARPHDSLSLTGGAIGQGIPVATGAAIAAPGRKVVNLQADGSGLYTLQALWTQAREQLDIVTVILSNRSYGVLRQELSRVGAGNPGPRAISMLDLDNPEIGWPDLARGFGVEGSRAETVEQFAAQFESAIAGRGPRLIEAVI